MQHIKVGIANVHSKAYKSRYNSGIWNRPIDYVVMASNLRALSHTMNKLFKYTDDTTLLVLEHTDVSLEEEFMALK
jgi:hypothetical protein